MFAYNILDMELLLYANELINQRKKLIDINSRHLFKAVGDAEYITANAKAEQIFDDLVSLYNYIKKSDPEVAEEIKNNFRETYYYSVFS